MEQAPFFDDRRRSPRHEVTIPATAVIFGASDLPAFTFKHATVRNVSREGLLLTSGDDKPPEEVALSEIFARGRSCHVSCKIPGSHRTSVFTGTIRWAGCYRSPERIEYRIGSSLEGCDERAIKSLTDLVTALEPDEDDDF